MESTESLLRKALFASGDTVTPGAPSGGGDLGGATQAPLSVEQQREFIRLMTAGQTILSDVRVVTSGSAKWQQTVLEFGSRIMRPGVEASRLAFSDRVKPSTGKVEINTELVRGEVPVSDESMEDIVGDLSSGLEGMITDRAGFDIEELLLNGDKSSGDAWLALLDGWLIQAKNGKAASTGVGATGNPVDASSYGQDYQEIFRVLLSSLPDKYTKGLEVSGRYYIPKRTEIKYRDEIANRGTNLGDVSLTSKNDLVYQGIKIVGVPNMAVSGGSTSSILLTDRSNLLAGFHRQLKLETWRDPREGVTSFIVTARVDAQVAVPAATAIGYNVDVSV